MLVGTYFKRPKAPVTLPGEPPRTYYFTPVNPADPSSIHVAEVTDEDHIARLLAIKEGYFEFTGAAPAVEGALTRAGGINLDASLAALDLGPAKEPSEDEARDAIVAEILALKGEALTKRVAKLRDPAVIRAAIVAEASKDDSRVTVIAALEARLNKLEG